MEAKLTSLGALTIPAISFAGGFFLNVVTKFGHGFVDEFFQSRQRKKKVKLELADQIMDICIEGSSTGWNVKPGSQRHIQRIIAEVETVDMEAANKLKQMLSVWVLNSIHQEPKAGDFIKVKELSREDIETARRWQEAAQNFSEELLAVAREWKK